MSRAMGGTTQIAIIGGGIGGLAAALSLRRAGFDVNVYEQVPVKREVGAGIVLTPNATRVLQGLGLGDALKRMAVSPTVVRQRRWQNGRTLLLAPVQQLVGPSGEPLFYTVHRADTLAMLTNALQPSVIHVGHRLVAIKDSNERVALEFANGEKATADLVIGADGIHSTVRKILLGPQQPRFTGCVAYRGMVAADRFPRSDMHIESQLWLGPGSHFIHYPVRSGELINFVCLIDRAAWTKESWTEPGDPADIRAVYAGWHEQVRALVATVAEIFVWGLFDREPLPRWSLGRITMLGDACHPMLPFLAQGAAQAIEDGATLAAILSQSADDVPAALIRYEKLRLPRTAAIQATARGNKDRNHLPDGQAQRQRDAQMASGAADWSIGASQWVYQHDAAAAAQTGALGLPRGANV
jgi:salicylate hydroxylase